MKPLPRSRRRIAVYLDGEDHRRFELLVARLGETQQEFLLRLLRPVLDAVRSGEPHHQE